MSDLSMEQRQNLVGDLKRVMSDAEALLSATASGASEEMSDLRFKLQTTLSQVKHNLLDAQDVVVHKAKAAAHVTDDYVHDHPWKAISAAAGIGLLLGLVIGRR